MAKKITVIFNGYIDGKTFASQFEVGFRHTGIYVSRSLTHPTFRLRDLVAIENNDQIG